MNIISIQNAKREGYALAQEIIAKEGWDFANDYMNASTAEATRSCAVSPSWFGFQDALVEHKGHYFRDGLLTRSY